MRFRSFVPLPLSLSLSLLLTGCALNPTASLNPAAGLKIVGKVQGGQQPIAGAQIYLLAANTTGYGQPSVSLLDGVATGSSDSLGAYVTTAADGSFSITGDYTCTPGTQVYLYALGGDPGAGVNSAAGLLAALGQCPASGSFLGTIPHVWINEVSTVAAAYSLAGYATDATHVSSSGTALAQTGIANAFANATNLASISSGAALASTPAGNGTVPQSEINTLANILASCINSTGPGSASCTTLFANAMSGGTTGVAPSDTATAAINIAHNPSAAVAALFGLQPGIAAPFQPNLSSAPNDFTLALTFTGGGISGASKIAIDAPGNIWISNGSPASLSKLSNLGVPLSPAAGYTDPSLGDPRGLAISALGDIWVANHGNSSLSEFSSSGVFERTASSVNLLSPLALAIDPTGNLWVPSSDGTTHNLNQFDGNGTYTATYTGNGLNNPNAVAIDQAGNVWVANQNNTISKFSGLGVPDVASPFLAGGLNNPQFIAFDALSNILALNTDTSLSAFTNAGAAVAGFPFNTGSTNSAAGFAMDGLGQNWLLTASSAPTAFQVLAIDGSGVPLSGASGYSLNATAASDLAIDGSGNVWICSDNQAIELIGAAAPVATPLVSAVTNNSLATRP